MYASGDAHTQTIEGFFGNVKNGIAGNYHGVSLKWLQSYLNEYTWRYNHRHQALDVRGIARAGRLSFSPSGAYAGEPPAYR